MFYPCRSRASCLSALGLTALLAASPAFALDLTRPELRSDQAALNVTKLESQGMRAIEGFAPATSADPGATVQGAFQRDAFVRFMQIGLNQSYGRTYQEGWNILHTVIQNSLTQPDMPQGLRLALEAGRDASYSKSWESAYEMLHETVSTSINQVDQLGGDPDATLVTLLGLARRCGYDKTYEEAWNALHTFIQKLEGDGRHFISNPGFELGLRLGREASYSKSYTEAYEILHTTLQHLEALPGSEINPWLYTLAIEASVGKTYESGFRVLETFVTGILASSLINDFDRLSLKTSLEASYGQSWVHAYETLRDGLGHLRH